MSVTNTPVFVQNPKVWSAAINNGDASAWKILRDAASAAGAGPNGSKITALFGVSSDTSSRDVQIAVARQFSCTFTNASPGVGTISSGANLANGDQLVLEGSAVPPGFTAGTTYFVVNAAPSTQAGVACTFDLAATLGGSAINTTGTGTSVVAYLMRIIGTVSMVAGSGNSSSVVGVNLLNSTALPALPVDNDGQNYLFLESTDFLAVSCTGTVTSAKMMWVTAIGGNF